MKNAKTIFVIIAISYILGLTTGFFLFRSDDTGPAEYRDDDSGTEQLGEDRGDAMDGTSESIDSLGDQIDDASGTSEELADSTRTIRADYTEFGKSVSEIEQSIEGDLEIARRIRELVRDGETSER